MHPYSSDTHSTPTINVNLKPCTCRQYGEGVMRHFDGCPHGPILIPCPIQRSVTFEVRLGECTCEVKWVPRQFDHRATCPARPIRVSCSIAGETWEESEVVECEVHHEGRETSPAEMLRDCRERWALVKAVVLGASRVSEFPEPYRMVPAVSEMLMQRNAVFSALADMARAEDVILEKERAIRALMPRDPFPGLRAQQAPSEVALLSFADHLIEQVGVMS